MFLKEQNVFCRLNQKGSTVYLVEANVSMREAKEICDREEQKHLGYLFFWLDSDAGIYDDALSYNAL